MTTNAGTCTPVSQYRPSSCSSDDDCTPVMSSKNRNKRPTFVYVLSGLSAIGGFLFGYDTGVVSGAMLLIRVEFQLSNNALWQELIVSATIAAAWMFSLIGGCLVDALGRKPVIIVASFVFCIGAFVMGASNTKEMLLIGRIIVGVGIGLTSVSVPMYLAEVSSPDIRGRLVTVNNIFITGGQFVASVVCGLFSTNQEHGWRFMLGLSAVPAIIQFVGFLGMPESPRWLVKKGQRDRAAAVLRTIRGADIDVDAEVESIRQSCEETEDDSVQDRSVIFEVLRTPSVRRALMVGCALSIFQQLAGINTVMYYSATIIQMAGERDTTMAVWLSAATASFNFVFTFLGLYLVEKVGRRPLTLGSLLGTIFSLLVLAVGFQLATINSPAVTFLEKSPLVQNDTCSSYRFCAPCTDNDNCGFCYDSSDGNTINGSCVSVLSITDVDSSLYGRCSNISSFTSKSTIGGILKNEMSDQLMWSHDYCPTSYQWLPIFGLCLYLLFFAPGMGPMPWTVNSEIYPLWARGTCYAISTSFNWLFNLVVSMTFLTLTDLLTKHGAFYLYAGISLVGLVYFFVALPETRGKTLEEVEGLFARPMCCGRGDNGLVPVVAASDRTVQYVHIRGLNIRDRQYSNDSGDDT